MNFIRILTVLLFTIHLYHCNINSALTTMQHLIDLDRLPHHITHKGCHQSQNEQTGKYVHCSHACLVRASPRYQCTIARVGCVQQERFDRFNFFELLYCKLDGQLVLFLPIALIMIVLIFRFISATVDEYISGGITYIAQGLNMSEQMAGVTLIALANGAGDVITAIVASGSQGGISYNIGALYGAGFFVCSFVIATTILVNKDNQPIQVSERIIYRDIGFYIIATIFTIIFALQSKVYWWSAVIFLVLYAVMVFVVYIQDRNDEQDKQDKEKALKDAIKDEIKSKSSGKMRFQQAGRKIIIRIKIARVFHKGYQSHHAKKKALHLTEIDEIHQKHKQEAKEHQKAIEQKIEKNEESLPIIDQFFDDNSDSSHLKLKEQLQIIGIKPLQSQGAQSVDQSASGLEEEDEDIPWEDKTLLQRIDFLVEIPFDFIRKITMPPCEEENFNKMLCTIWPFPGVIFILWVFDVVTILKFQILGLVLACILSFIFYETQKDLKEKEVPSYFFWICMTGTVLGLMWTYILSDMLIDLLNTFAVIFQLNNTYMGLTILGIGNALPDALTTIALAKRGFAQMGLTGCYAGQLFGLLVGFGIAQLKQTLITGEPQDFSLFKHPKNYLLDIIVITAQFTTLVVTSIFAIKNNMFFTRSLAYFGLIIYIVFFVIATGVQIYYIVDSVKP